MGNETSVEEARGVKLQTQDSDHLWTILHQSGEEEEEEEEGGEEGVQEVGEGGVSFFVHSPSQGTEAEQCRSGVDHLRLMRHPNIVKFLQSNTSHDRIVMVTEPVVPLHHALEGMNSEALVLGWRGVAIALHFLHSKAGISHNNVSMDAVFVSTTNSLWKLGGFEAACKHGKMDAKFLAYVSSIRNAKAIPPEDKSSSGAGAAGGSHSRDTWAFGQLMLTLLEDSGLDSGASGDLSTYVQTKMLNHNPQLRPTSMEVMGQPWMNNDATVIAEFLNHLTVKTKHEKDAFFRCLPSRLHGLPPAIIAEYLVPLLVVPIVMAEPIARGNLWTHLLCPASPSMPRAKQFRVDHVCPLLNVELFVSHLTPLLLNLLGSRDLHVRLVLLEHMASFAPACSHEDLTNTVLPEVLIGLKDSRDEVVSATLSALAALVPLLGGDAVTGTARDPIFADTRPRDGIVPVAPIVSEIRPPIQPHNETAHILGTVSAMPSSRADREEKAKRMREKREEQKRKMAERKKLGGKLNGDANLSGHIAGGAEWPGPAPSDHAQPSPNVSHSEEGEGEGGERSGPSGDESWDDFEDETESDSHASPRRPGNDMASASTAPDRRESQERGIDTNGFEAENPRWGDSLRKDGSLSAASSSASRSGLSLTGQRKSRPNSESGASSKSQPASHGSDTASSQGSGSVASQGGKKSRGIGRERLSKEDIQRLEEQEAWATEPDFFADMAPSIAPPTKAMPLDGLGVGEMESAPLASMQYQPVDQAGGGWGDGEDWNDF